MERINETPFQLEPLAVNDLDGTDMLSVLVKATWSFADPDAISVAEEQEPIALADVFEGDPETSSLTLGSDFAIRKPACDVIVTGNAYPEKQGDREAIVGFRVGSLSRRMRVSGERRWTRGLTGYKPSRPEPFASIPLSFANDFGGHDTSHENPERHDSEQRNPAGRGFRAAGSKLSPRDMTLPNFEDPEHPLTGPDDRPAPVVPGFVPPGWLPRRAHAGTYDKTWQDHRMPLLPEDFDTRFFLGSNAVYPGFPEGGEAVYLQGLGAGKPRGFSLPDPGFTCRVHRRDGDPEPLALRWDRLVIDGDHHRLIGVFCGEVPTPGGAEEIAEIRLEGA